MKQFLGGTHMHSNVKVKKMIKDWVTGLATDFYDVGIHKLIA
jgi:hypothetical protein